MDHLIIDADTGAYLWRSTKQAGVTIPTCNLVPGQHPYVEVIVLRFRPGDTERETYERGCARYEKWKSKHEKPAGASGDKE